MNTSPESSPKNHQSGNFFQRYRRPISAAAIPLVAAVGVGVAKISHNTDAHIPSQVTSTVEQDPNGALAQEAKIVAQRFQGKLNSVVDLGHEGVSQSILQNPGMDPQLRTALEIDADLILTPQGREIVTKYERDQKIGWNPPGLTLFIQEPGSDEKLPLTPGAVDYGQKDERMVKDAEGNIHANNILLFPRTNFPEGSTAEVTLRQEATYNYREHEVVGTMPLAKLQLHDGKWQLVSGPVALSAPSVTVTH